MADIPEAGVTEQDANTEINQPATRDADEVEDTTDKPKDKEENEDKDKDKKDDTDEDPWVEVINSGIPIVNGRYIPEGLRDGVPRFVKKVGAKVYEVSRVPTRTSSKNWWISRTDVTPDIDYFTARSNTSLPPEGKWMRCSQGKDPVPTLQLNDKAKDLKDKPLPDKYKRKDQPKNNRNNRRNQQNDGLPTVPQRVQGQKGVVELEVRVHDLRSEVDKYMDWKINKDTKVLEPTFRCVERKLRVDIKDQLVSINGVEMMGKAKSEIIDFIEALTEYKCKIWLLKKRLLNTEMIDEDTMKCLVGHRDLAQEVKNFMEIRNGTPTFRCNEKKLYVDKGDQLLRIEDIDVSEFNNKLEVHNVVMSIGKPQVHIWIRKEEARRARERRRRQEQEKELQAFYEKKAREARGRKGEQLPTNKQSNLVVLERFDLFDELTKLDRTLPENADVPPVNRVRFYFHSKLPRIGNIELFVSFHDANWAQQDVYYAMRKMSDENKNTFWFDMDIPRPVAGEGQPLKKNLFRMTFTFRMGAEHYRLNQAFDFPVSKMARVVDYEYQFEEVKNVLNIMQPNELLNKKMKEVLRLVRDEDREQSTQWNYWSSQWSTSNNNNSNKSRKERPWVRAISFHLAIALRGGYPLNLIVDYCRGCTMLKKKLINDRKQHFNLIGQTIASDKAKVEDLLEYLYWHLIFDECPSPRRMYDFVVNAVRLAGGDIMTILNRFAGQISGMTGLWKSRTHDLFREEIRKYADCMYCAVYSNFLWACCQLIGEEGWTISSTMDAELRGIKEYCKINDLLKALQKEMLPLDLMFAQIGEKGRILPVERIPLERHLQRITSASKDTSSTTNTWTGVGWTTVSTNREATPEQRREAFWEVLILLSKLTGVVEDKCRVRIINDFCLHFRDPIAMFLGTTFDHHLKLAQWLAENGFQETMVEVYQGPLPEQVLTLETKGPINKFITLVETYPVLLTANTRKSILENLNLDPGVVVRLAFRANLEEGRENTISYAARVYFETLFDKVGPARVFELWTVQVEDPILKLGSSVDALKGKVESISGFELITQFLNNDFVHRMEPVILQVLKERMAQVDNLDLDVSEQAEMSSIVATRLKDGDEVKIDLWNQILTQVLHIHEDWALEKQLRFVCTSCQSVVTMCNSLVKTLKREQLPSRITLFYDYFAGLVTEISLQCAESQIVMCCLEVLNDFEPIWIKMAKTVPGFSEKALQARLKQYRACVVKRDLLRTLMARYIPADTDRLGGDLQALAKFAKLLQNWDRYSVADISSQDHLNMLESLRAHLEFLKMHEPSLVFISIWQTAFGTVLQNATGVDASHEQLSVQVGLHLMDQFNKIAQKNLRVLSMKKMLKYLKLTKGYAPDQVAHNNFILTDEQKKIQSRTNKEIEFEATSMFQDLSLAFATHNDFIAFHQRLDAEVLQGMLARKNLFVEKEELYARVSTIEITACGVPDLCGQFFSEAGGYTLIQDNRRYRINKQQQGKHSVWSILRTDRAGIAHDQVYFTCRTTGFNPPKDSKVWRASQREFNPPPMFQFSMENAFLSPPCLRSVFADVLLNSRTELKRLETHLQKGYLKITDLHTYFNALLKEEHDSINKQLEIFSGVAKTVCDDIYDSFCLQKEVKFLQDLVKLAEGLGKYCRSIPQMDEGFKQIRDSVHNVETISDMADNIAKAAGQFNEMQNILGAIKFDDVQKSWATHLSNNLQVVEAMATEPHLKDDQEFGNLLELLDANQTNGLEAQRSVSLRKVRQACHQTFIRGNFKNLTQVINALANMRLSESDVDDLVTVTESLDQIARTYNEASGDSLARDKRILYNALEYGSFEMVNPPLSSSVELAELARKCLSLRIDESQRGIALKKAQASNFTRVQIKAPPELKRVRSAGDAVEDTQLAPPAMGKAKSLPDAFDDGADCEDIIVTERVDGITLSRYGLQIRIQDVKAGTRWDTLGFQAGDVLQAINGQSCVEPVTTLNQFNNSELPMSVLVKHSTEAEKLLPPTMEKQSSVDADKQAAMLDKVKRNPMDELLTSTVVRHSSDNLLSGMLEELEQHGNVALEEKQAQVDTLSFENVESILDRLLMAILRKDVELKAKTLELESKFKLVESVCRLRCNYYLLGGRQYLSESAKVLLSVPIAHLESMERVWQRRLQAWIKKVMDIRETYPWLNYYTVNETLVVVELLNRLCIKAPEKVKISCRSLDRINGDYQQQPELLYGRPCYRRVQKPGEVEVDFILWFYSKRRVWCLSKPSQIEKEVAFLINKSAALDPTRIKDSEWMMFDNDNEDGYSEGHVVKIVDAKNGSFHQVGKLFEDLDEAKLEKDLTKYDEILTHLQYAKPNCTEAEITIHLKAWDPLNNEHPNLLEEVGRFLDKVLGTLNKNNYRQLPDIANIITGIEDAKPNLYTSDSQRALSCVSAIFLQRNLVPIANQVLLCSKHTSAEEVEILLRRCFHAGREIQLSNGLSPLFVLAFPENLTNDTLKTVLDVTQEFLLSDEALERFKQNTYCFAIVSCSRDNKLTQRFLQFERDNTWLNQREAMQLYAMTLCESERGFYEQRHEADIRPFVQVFASKDVGAGKSYCIQDWGQRNKCEIIRVPINSTDLQPSFVIERLRKGNQRRRRVIHFDISSCAGSSVNLVLFKLVMLHHITDSGLRYQVSSRDAFLIELPTSLTISGDELEALVLQSTDITAQSVDSRFWFCSVQAGLPRRNVNHDNNVLRIGEDEQFTLKYLRAFKKRTTVQFGGLRGTGRDDDADFDPFMENCPNVSMEEALALMQEYCPAGVNSRICQKNFLKFMHTQLVQIHANIYLMNWNSPQPGQIHLREMVLESMINMSQDFSSKLYNDASGIEDSTADAKFPLSVRWRQTEIPMVLLNQIGVKQSDTAGDISLFCRNLKRLRSNPTAQMWSQIVELYQWRLVNFEREEEQRRNQLNDEGIVSDSEAAKRQKLDLLLKVVGAPDEAIRLSRVQHIMEKHKNYALTFDNMLKMIAIYFRVKSGIPVLLMGETGCGKTRLMEFLSDILAIELFKCDVHGGFTSNLILKFMEEPINTARKTPHDMIWVFLDEVNTSPEIGMFKEIICDHSLNGEPLPRNLVVLGALNPVRRRKKVSAGIVQKDQAGVETYMNNLVYRVYPLPPTMKEYVWNFGHLDELDEQQYIGEMLQLAFRNEMEVGEFALVLPRYQQTLGKDLVEDLVDCVRVSFCKCLVESQKIVRKVFGGEVSVVSLRDVARCIKIFSWFFKHFDMDRIAVENPRDQLYRLLMESAILALGHCYYYRLGGSRDEYSRIMDGLIDQPVEVTRVIEAEPIGIDPEVLNFIPLHERAHHLQQLQIQMEKSRKVQRRLVEHAPSHPFIKVLQSEQDRYVQLMEIPKGVATNRALKENLFMILVCVMTRLPIVLVGKPGSSKTLSMVIIRDNLSASTKNERLSALGFQDVYLVPFQCSKHSTAAAIKDRWDFAASYQEADPNIKVMIFFDEVGLAEQSPHRPLKVFHQLLEHPVISFVGLSNWALDSAKMNRAILHNCPTHSFQDLMQTATAIVSSSTDNKAVQDMLCRSLKTIATLYSSVLQKQKIADFFGARDFYACVQLITARIKVQLQEGFATEIPTDIMFEAIVRSFGGLEIEEMRNLLAECCVNANDRMNREQIMEELHKWNGVRALEQNLIQTRAVKDTDVLGSQARHILVLSDFETSWQILFDANILDNSDTVVIFGSQFVQDLNSTVGLYHAINRVKNCIETGQVVVLLHLEALHDALYDMLNQRYTRIGKRLYCRIAMGAESVICQVHPHFKCIVVGAKQDAYTGRIPVAFLNRFEKQVVDRRQLMDEKARKADRRMVLKFNLLKNFEANMMTVDRFFSGFMDETLPSLFAVLLARDPMLEVQDLVEQGFKILLRNANAECFVQEKTRELFEPFTDIVQCLEMAHEESWKAQKGIMQVIRTHDRIYASDTIQQCFEDSKLEVKCVQLDEFLTEVEFSQFLTQFANNRNVDTLIVQCNHKGTNLPHILHAKHMVERVLLSEMPETKHLVLLIHTPRIRKNKTSAQVGGRSSSADTIFPLVFDKQWDSVYVDALLPGSVLGVPSIKEVGHSIIPQILERDPSTALLRVFRKALTQLRFAQPVKMLEEIKAIQALLSEKSWDNGTLLKLLTSKLLAMLDTDEFKRPVSSVVLERIKGEAVTQWARGAFRDRLVNFTDKIIQNCFAHQLKLLYEHGNFKLYTETYFKQLQEEQGDVIRAEYLELWIKTVSDDSLVRPVRIAISDRPDSIHVPHAYNAKFPFSATVDSWACSKRSEIEALVPVGEKQRSVAEILAKLVLAQNWKVSYSPISQYGMDQFVKDMLNAHMKEIYTERTGEDVGTMNEDVRTIAKSFIFQSALTNAYVVVDELQDKEEEMEDVEDAKDFKDEEEVDKQAEQQRREEIEKVKAEVSLHDVFPAFWYNWKTISHVLRLFCINEESMRKIIMKIWTPSATTELEKFRVQTRVAFTLRMSVNAFSKLLKEATVETLSKTTEMIVSARNSVDELLAWLEMKQGAQSIEDIVRSWRMLQLKLMLARNIELDPKQRSQAFRQVEHDFFDARMFGISQGFKALINIVEDMISPNESELLSRVILQFLQRFAFEQENIELQLVKNLLALINPVSSSLVSEGYELTDVAKVQIAWHLVRLMNDVSIGPQILEMINDELAGCEVLDDELPCLFLAVVEENMAKMSDSLKWKRFKFTADTRVSFDYLQQIARGKLIITTYCKNLCATIVKPELATLQMIGGEKLFAKMLTILYPQDEPFLPFHYFFLKQLFRFGGVTWVHAFCENPEIVEKVVAKIPIMERVQICSEVDPYVVWGEAYRTIKDELTAITAQPDRNFGLQITMNDLAPFVTALYSTVYRPSTLNGINPALLRFLQSPNAAQMFKDTDEAALVLQLALNKFPAGSKLNYHAEFNQWDRYITQISAHMVAVMPKCASSFWSNLVHRPERYLEGFIPSMPKDTSEALGNLVGAAAWVCPNGHVYYIGDCTRPWVEATCHCGAKIGGVNHNAVAGNDRLEAKRTDRASEHGYLLMGTDGEFREMKAIREMDVQTVKIMRLLVHVCLLLAQSQTGHGPKPTVETLVRGLRPHDPNLVPPPAPADAAPQANPEHANLEQNPNEPVDYSDKGPVAKLCQGQGYGKPLSEFLYSQVRGYLEQLATILELQVEEAVLFLHLVIRQFAQTYNDAFPEGIFKLDEEERNQFEVYFAKQVVKPLLPAQRAVEALRNEHLQLNELLAEMWEKVDLSTQHGEQFAKTYLPNLMLSIQSMDLDGFTITLLRDQRNQQKYPCLWALATARPSIWVIRYLPMIHKWCKMMVDRYNRKITRDRAKKLMVGAILEDIKESFWGDREEWARVWKDFLRCWNEIYRLINIDDHTRLDELRHDCVHIYQYIMKFSENPYEVSAVWACPDEQDEGLCINTIVEHLVTVHNRFMTESGNASASAPIMNSDVCGKQNLTNVDKDDVEAMIRSHCVRPLRYGASSKLVFDLDTLEKEMKDRYVLGKGEVRAMLPFFEFAGVVKIESLFDSTGLKKEKLETETLRRVCDFQSGLERQHALEIVEETILLLARLGVDSSGEQPVFEFMKSVLRMERRDWQLFYHREYGHDIRLKHLFHIWMYLQKQIAYDDPKRLKAPESCDLCYREPISEPLLEDLIIFRKTLGLGEMEELVFKWFDVLKSACSEPRKDCTQRWAIWLQHSDFSLPKLLDDMPGVTLAEAATVYEYLAEYFFKMRGSTES